MPNGLRRLAPTLLLAALGPAAAQDGDGLPPHPRIWIGGKNGAISLQELRNRVEGDYAEAWKSLRSLDGFLPKALRVLLGDEEDGILDDVKATLRAPAGPDSEALIQRAAAYDWIHGRLRLEERRELGRRILDDADLLRVRVEREFCAYRHDIAAGPIAVAAAAYAAYEDDPRSKALTRWYRPFHQRFVEITGDGAAPTDMAGRAGAGGGWPEGFGFDRKASRVALMGLWAVRSATGEDSISSSAYWKDKIQYLLHATMPDGRRVYAGDDVDRPTLVREDRETMLMLQAAFKDPFAQTWLSERAAPIAASAPFDLVFSNAHLEAKPLAEVPTARHFPGIGLAVFRTGWGPDDACVTFRASDWFTEKQHNAQNVFTIFRGEPIAFEPGEFEAAPSAGYANWRVRTISHNGLLVPGIGVDVKGPPGLPALADDGGQLVQQWRGDPRDLAAWRAQASTVPRDIVDWLAFRSTPDFDLAAANAGRAYPVARLSEAIRVLFFAKPDWIVVVDRVRLPDPKQEVVAVTHLAGGAAIQEKKRLATVDVGETRLTVYPVWPEQAGLRLAGPRPSGAPGESPEAVPGARLERPAAAGASMLQVTAPAGDPTRLIVVAYHLGAAKKPPPAAPKVDKAVPRYVRIELDRKRRYEIRLDSPGAAPYK
jgi:hypothetical protein